MSDDKKPHQVRILQQDGRSKERQVAELFTQGLLPASSVLRNFSSEACGEELPITEMHEELAKISEAAAQGDLSQIEKLLCAQILALNGIFTGLAHRSKSNSANGYTQAADTYMRLALRAQAQCRHAAETLYEMKNPRPVAFVQQANINNGGQQQINNGHPSPAPGRQTDIPQSKLLENQDGERLDFGAQAAGSGADPDMASLGEVHRPEDR